MAEAEKVLEMKNITMQFGGVVAVNNLSLNVNKGEIVSLLTSHVFPFIRYDFFRRSYDKRNAARKEPR